MNKPKDNMVYALALKVDGTFFVVEGPFKSAGDARMMRSSESLEVVHCSMSTFKQANVWSK